MRSTLALASLAAALALAPGCAFYFGGDDDDDCDWGGEAPPDGDPSAAIGLRNPVTGQCEYYGGGGGGCDDPCGPCEDYGEADRAPLPSWGYCESYCTGLDEPTCLATAGCRGGYLETCSENQPCDTATQRTFLECWAVDQSGPIQGSCEGLDAWTCSMHDDCLAVHYDLCNAWAAEAAGEPLIDPAGCLGEFLACHAEAVEDTGCYSDAECADDEHCNAAEVCLPPPDCTDTNNDGLIDCDSVCYGWCVPDEDPPPPPPPPACEELVTENECVARPDCTALYQGVNCTCDPVTNTCTCEDWVFDGCVTGDQPEPPPDQ